ncbi:hypothetical protein [Streptomyces flaveolus]|uniref:hypothetical protein n=1 Tax=Streptomyces flaveolus TaxID=67297 RepID=UPI0033CF47D2
MPAYDEPQPGYTDPVGQTKSNEDEFANYVDGEMERDPSWVKRQQEALKSYQSKGVHEQALQEPPERAGGLNAGRFDGRTETPPLVEPATFQTNAERTAADEYRSFAEKSYLDLKPSSDEQPPRTISPRPAESGKETSWLKAAWNTAKSTANRMLEYAAKSRLGAMAVGGVLGAAALATAGAAVGALAGGVGAGPGAAAGALIGFAAGAKMGYDKHKQYLERQNRTRDAQFNSGAVGNQDSWRPHAPVGVALLYNVPANQTDLARTFVNTAQAEQQLRMQGPAVAPNHGVALAAYSWPQSPHHVSHSRPAHENSASTSLAASNSNTQATRNNGRAR